jgi:biotin transport system substrate-specific component
MKRVEQTLSLPLGGATAERAMLSIFFLMATFLGAYVVVPLPFTPVPVTLQTLFVLLGGAWLGTAWACGVQATYLGMGAAGLSVFAGAAGGFIYLLGPTAGYLWAFLPAAILVGHFYKKAATRGTVGKFVLFAVADALILLSGALWLGFVMHLSAGQMVLLGVAPFVPGEIAKILCATAFSPSLTRAD